MLFRDKFLGTPGRPLGEEPSNWIARVTEGGFRVSLDLQKAQMKLLKSGFEHVAQTQIDTSEALRGEFAYQIDRLNKQLVAQTSEIVAGQAEIVGAIQQMSDYLGAGLTEVRWAVERHTRVSEEQLRLLLDSLSNESRQYFEQGVKCYDVKEDQIAKECFRDALSKNKTNFFAYQYLGFIAVHENNENEATRNFDLARKFAEIEGNNYHQALALSHLARTRQASDDLETAFAFAKKATSTYPNLAKFWYELAGYAARLGRTTEAIDALREAIERDWTFFTIVVGDTDFGSIRPEVNSLLDSLRERERVKARDALENLRHAISTAQKCGADNEVAAVKKTLSELETKYRQNNVFLYREITRKAEELRSKVFETAEKTLSKTIAEKEAEISRNQRDRESELYGLRSKQGSLKSKSKSVDRRKMFTDPGGYFAAYLILAVVTFVVAGVLLLNNAIRGDIATYVCLSPIVIIVAIQILVFIFGKAIPKGVYEARLSAEEHRVAPLIRNVERKYADNQATLQSELARLKANLERCKRKEFI